MRRCDVLVLGAGAVGSSAMLHLAQRGLDVVGLDRFQPPHARGSSHGQTRAIRQAYFEHPDYVPLLKRAYMLWERLEAEYEQRLFHQVGLVEAGPADGIVVPGVLESASQHQLPVQRWTVDEARRQVPQLQLDESLEIVFEEQAGFLLVEDCVDAQLTLAQRCGAALQVSEVRQVRATEGSVEVTTDGETFQAAAAVITAGAWAAELLSQAGVMPRLPLRVLRKHLHWHPAPSAGFGVGEFPVFFVEERVDEADSPLPTRFFYGFPRLDDRGVKVAEHSDGAAAADPLNDDREKEAADVARVEHFVRRRLPQLTRQAKDHAVCFYTMSPDDHFVVDTLPESPQVAYAAGLSGHGFKFATALGEVLAQLATGQPPSCEVGFLQRRDWS